MRKAAMELEKLLKGLSPRCIGKTKRLVDFGDEGGSCALTVSVSGMVCWLLDFIMHEGKTMVSDLSQAVSNELT